VFVVGDAVDGHVHRDRLRRGEIAVGFFLGDLGKRADEEWPQVRYAGRRADSQAMAPQRAIGRDLEERLDRGGVYDFEFGDFDAGFVEEDFLSFIQLSAAQYDFDLGPPLPAAW